MKNFKIKDCFSKKLYIESLNQTKISGFFMIISSIILCSLHPFVELISFAQRPSHNYVQTIDVLTGNVALLVLMYIIPMFMAFDGFQFLSKRKDCDFYHSIPVKRQSIFASFALAGITWTVVSLVIGGLLSTCLFAFVPNLHIPIAGCLKLIITVVAGALMIYFGSLLAISLSGNKMTQILLALAIVFLPQITCYVMLGLIDDIARVTMLSSIGSLVPLIPFGALFGYSYTGFAEFFSVSTQLKTLLYAVVCGFLAMLTFVRRKSELAGNNAPSRIAQHIYRTVIMIPFILMTAVMITENTDISVFLIIFAISFVIYVGYELATVKNYKLAIKSLPFYAVCVALVVVMLVVVNISAFAVGSITPSADKIKSVNILTGSKIGSGNSEYTQAKSNHDVLDEEIIEIIATSLENTVEAGMEKKLMQENGVNEWYLVRARINTGLISYDRKLFLSEEELNIIDRYFAKQTEMNELLIKMPNKEDVLTTSIYGVGLRSGTNIPDEVLKEVLDMMYEELDSISLEDRYKVIAHDSNPDIMPVFAAVDTTWCEDFEFRVNLKTLDEYGAEVTSVFITPLMPKTYAYLINYACQNQIIENGDIQKFINAIEQDSDIYIDVQITDSNMKFGNININSYTSDSSRYTNDDCIEILNEISSVIEEEISEELYIINLSCEFVSDEERYYDEDKCYYVYMEFITSLTQENLEFFYEMSKK